MINIQTAPFIMDCAWQLYGTENLHVLRHPTTAAVLHQDINNCHTISMNGSSGKHTYSGIFLKCLPCHWDCTAFPLLHSHASMHCITVLLLSFYWFVLPYVYSYSCNSTVYVTQVKGIVLRILYTHVCCDHRAAWGAKVKHLRRLAIVGPISWCWIICTPLEMLRWIT